MILLDGKKAKVKLVEDLKKNLSKLDRQLGLSVIKIGDDFASDVYIKNKEKIVSDLNINFNHYRLDEKVVEDDVLSLINDLNNDDMVDGIIIQKPIPKHLNSEKIFNAISPYKDVDGLTDINIGRLAHNSICLVSCTAMGILDLLDFYNINVSSKNVVVIGRSNLVGKPLSLLLVNRDATITLCHAKTNNLKEITKIADILVVAVGKPRFINEDYIKDGVIVIDVGINRTSDGLVGDVDFDGVKDKVSYITTVPGGVGQMTVYELANNVYKAYKLKKEAFHD